MAVVTEVTVLPEAKVVTTELQSYGNMPAPPPYNNKYGTLTNLLFLKVQGDS